MPHSPQALELQRDLDFVARAGVEAAGVGAVLSLALEREAALPDGWSTILPSEDKVTQVNTA